MFEKKIEKAEKRAGRKKSFYRKFIPFGFVALISALIGFFATGSYYFILMMNLVGLSILFLYLTAKIDEWYAEKIKRDFKDL